MKYVDVKVTFAEIPDEITLCIDISNCPYKCYNCHSSYLQKDIGEELTFDIISSLINKNEGITCLCIMGGDKTPVEVNNIFAYIKQNFPNIKTAWYSGNNTLNEYISLPLYNYIKIGSYNEQLGGLNSNKTNQKLYKVLPDKNEFGNFVLKDITNKFWLK